MAGSRPCRPPCGRAWSPARIVTCSHLLAATCLPAGQSGVCGAHQAAGGAAGGSVPRLHGHEQGRVLRADGCDAPRCAALCCAEATPCLASKERGMAAHPTTGPTSTVPLAAAVLHLAGSSKPEARKEMWQGGVKRCFFCTPQTFWNDVRRGAWGCRSRGGLTHGWRHLCPLTSLLRSPGHPSCRCALLPAGICPYEQVVCLVVDECHRAVGGWRCRRPCGWSLAAGGQAARCARAPVHLPVHIPTFVPAPQATRRLCRQ